jgi:hypothetical protein
MDVRFAGPQEPIDDLRVHVRTAVDDRPFPRPMSPSVFLSIVGQSVAWVTSTAIATCGSTRWQLVLAPRRPISSWTVEATDRAQGSGPAATARRKASRTTQRPILSSIATEAARPFRSGWYFSSKVAESPIRTTLSASALSWPRCRSRDPSSSERFSAPRRSADESVCGSSPRECRRRRSRLPPVSRSVASGPSHRSAARRCSRRHQCAAR